MTRFSRLMVRLASSGLATAATLTLLSSGTASAAPSERVCGPAFCNTTYGNGLVIYEVNGSKRGSATGTYGFFEVFGAGWHKPGPSNSANSVTIPISRTVKPNELICLRYFRYTGTWWEVDKARCTSAPIG